MHVHREHLLRHRIGTVRLDRKHFQRLGGRTSRVGVNDAGSLSSANTFNPLPGAVLEVSGTTVSEDATWSPDPGPFEILSTALIVQGTDGPDNRTTLSLDPGVAIRLPSNGTVRVGGLSGDPAS